MSLEYTSSLPYDISFIQYSIYDKDNIEISIVIECSIKGITINNYQDILDWENNIKIPFENYYSEYLSNNLPPESFNGRESVYDYANNFLNGLDVITFPTSSYYISAEKYDTVNKNYIFYDFYSKNLIDVTTNKKGINIR